jgi:hypothetical protein
VSEGAGGKCQGELATCTRLLAKRVADEVEFLEEAHDNTTFLFKRVQPLDLFVNPLSQKVHHVSGETMKGHPKEINLELLLHHLVGCCGVGNNRAKIIKAVLHDDALKVSREKVGVVGCASLIVGLEGERVIANQEYVVDHAVAVDVGPPVGCQQTQSTNDTMHHRRNKHVVYSIKQTLCDCPS